jgi:SOS-response transcriptional repressor LexA
MKDPVTYEPIDGSTISVHTGFPNAADDSRLQALSLDTLLIPNPNSTFHFRVSGTHWQEIGVFDGDIALVDRAVSPRNNDIVVWVYNDEFALSLYRRVPKDAKIWGVVTATIHQFRK